MYSNKIIKRKVIIHHKIKTKHFLSCDINQIKTLLITIITLIKLRDLRIVRNISNLLIFNYMTTPAILIYVTYQRTLLVILF